MKITRHKLILMFGLMIFLLVVVFQTSNIDYKLKILKTEIYLLNESIDKVKFSKPNAFNFSMYIYMKKELTEIESQELLIKIKEIPVLHKEQIWEFYKNESEKPSFYIYLDFDSNKKFDYLYQGNYYKNLNEKDTIDNYQTWDFMKLQ